MTLLVTGADGQLGRALRRLAPDARFTTRAELDVADTDAVAGYAWEGVTGIVNAAAWTRVDDAEDHVAEAWQANATAPALLAERARALGVPLVQVSTDYVFPGTATAPIAVDAPVAPLGVYGLTKAAGETAARLAPQHYVVRTSWVYGDGGNFVRTVRRLAQTREELRVVDDQRGRPTHAGDLAAALLHLLATQAPAGTYHATGTGEVVSWADVAAAALVGTTCRVTRVSTQEYGVSRAPRPAYSALEVSPQVAGCLRDWRVALADFLATEG